MSYRSPPPELSNNPFIDHPSNALSRFPNLETPDDYSGQTQRYTSWMNGGGSGAPSASSPSQSQHQNYATPTYPQQSQQTGMGWNAGGAGYPQSPTGYGAQQPQLQMMSSGRPFQPSSSSGQQLASQITGAYGGGGMPQQQQQPPQQQMQVQYTGYQTSPYQSGYPTGYNPYAQQQQQQQQQPIQYLSDFDPYAPGSAPGQVTAGPGSAYAQQHHREYVQQHKAELEAWDNFAWKQVRRLILLAHSESASC